MKRNDYLIRPILVVSLFLLLLCIMASYYLAFESEHSITQVLAELATFDVKDNVILWYMSLPRLFAGILAGMALALAGALFQEASRNLLASPNLLGVSSGTHLALVIGLIWFPAFSSSHLILFAFVGGMITVTCVFLITRKDPQPVRIIFSGVAISLALSALAAILSLFFEQNVGGLFLWGAGDVEQQGWANISHTWAWIIIPSVFIILFNRYIAIYALGDDQASALGIPVTSIRWLMIIIGVILTASAVILVGPVSFIGLFIPNILRVLKVKLNAFFFIITAMLGAVILPLADLIHLSISHYYLYNIPVGVLTAALGAPILLVALSKLGHLTFSQNESIKLIRLKVVIKARYLIILLIFCSILSLIYSSGIYISIKSIVTYDLFKPGLNHFLLFNLRLPRICLAILAGGALAVSGLFFQGIIRNVLASPEVLGISQGSTSLALFLLLFVPQASWWSIQLAAIIGGLAAFLVVILVARKMGFRPLQLAMIGISLGALYAALNTSLLAFAGMRVSETIRWLSGSLYGADWSSVNHLLYIVILILPICYLVAPWIDQLALGEEKAKSLGLNLSKAKFILLLLATILSASVVASIGMLGFIGLMAPHLARIMGYKSTRNQVIISFLIGAILTLVADLLGSIIFSPNEIPAGLVASVIGTIYLLFLLNQQAKE
ncbi:MAG: iron ABC transporter permease [Gammaproteobacteria bacterium]|nr:MAG: iron ABC transporter permease [Gammaproteobacteria bacterium]UTW42767.1 iron ABC transporter permease [bacterium SCSIO 12844]